MAAWAGTATPGTQEKQAAAGRLENAHAAWDDTITLIDEARKKQMAAPGLAEPAKKALATLDREWDGLTAHRDYPMVSSADVAAVNRSRRSQHALSQDFRRLTLLLGITGFVLLLATGAAQGLDSKKRRFLCAEWHKPYVSAILCAWHPSRMPFPR